MKSALATDLYQLTMAAGYHHAAVSGRATFELFVRNLPAHRGYLVAAGLDPALAFLEQVRFTSDEIAFLRSVPTLARAGARFFDEVLPAFRFRGDVWAMQEGEPFFGGEPVLRVTARAAEAQLVETALLALVTFPTTIASKAARIVQAARGRPVVEFGSRRAHGLDAALQAARAAYIAGCTGTSNVEAGFRFGVPVAGTMAHSWVLTFEREIDAFRSYLDLFGSDTTLLVDTYDSAAAVDAIVEGGLKPSAVRLDSGDLAGLSRIVRQRLDAGGLASTTIFASGDLDEHRIGALLAEEAPIDAFGVGTALSTSADSPALGGVYKLVAVERGGRMVPVAKLSAGKRTYGGAKQVWRVYEGETAVRDWIGLDGVAPPEHGRALLQPVMANGRRLGPQPPLAETREACRQRVEELPAGVRRLQDWSPYDVRLSPAVGG